MEPELRPPPPTHPSGVSGALKKRTGPQPWRDLARMGVLAHGDAVATDAGTMPGPDYLIHVAGLTAWWRATPGGVTRCVRNAIRVAHGLGVSSLAMPLIGAGTGGLSEAASRAAIHEGLGNGDLDDIDLEVAIATRHR